MAEVNLSCADIALRDAQGLTFNQAIAAVAADYLVRLLLTDNLDRFQTTTAILRSHHQHAGSSDVPAHVKMRIAYWRSRQFEAGRSVSR